MHLVDFHRNPSTTPQQYNVVVVTRHTSTVVQQCQIAAASPNKRNSPAYIKQHNHTITCEFCELVAKFVQLSCYQIKVAEEETVTNNSCLCIINERKMKITEKSTN